MSSDSQNIYKEASSVGDGGGYETLSSLKRIASNKSGHLAKSNKTVATGLAWPNGVAGPSDAVPVAMPLPCHNTYYVPRVVDPYSLSFGSVSRGEPTGLVQN